MAIVFNREKQMYEDDSNAEANRFLAQAQAKPAIEPEWNSVTDKYSNPGNQDFISGLMQGLPEQTQPPMEQPVSKPINPQVAEYIQSKIKSSRVPAAEPQEMMMPPPQPGQNSDLANLLAQYSPEKYKQALKESQSRQADTGFAQMASGIGDALARRDSSSTDKYFSDLRGNIQDQTVGEFNRQKASVLSDMSTKQKMDLMDPNSEKSKSFRSQVEAMMPNIAKSYGKNWAQVSAADGDSILNLGKFKEAQETRKQQMQMHQDYKRDQAGQKNDLRAEKRKEREEQLAVPGYERTGEVLQKPEEAMKLRKATASAEQLQSKLGRLKELVKSDGSFEYGGKNGAEMESLATEIQLLAKGEDMYQLGVLTGPDMSLLQKITADPASMNSLFTRDGTRLKQIDTQLKSIQDKLGSVTKASGYRPKASESAPSAQPEGASNNDQDKQAIEWAQQNPKDPRAKQILKLHGM